MRVAVSGATGLIGSRLVAELRSVGHEAVTISRRPGVDTIVWDPDRGVLADGAIDGFDAVVNLAGEPIGAKRWTTEQKRRIVDSRVRSTELLVDAMARSSRPPTRFLSGSAIGYYGDCGAQVLTENSPAGSGFLADVVRRWEAAAAPAVELGVSTALLRTGIVLSAEGGALKQQLLPFKLGLGGRSGNGRQFQSWIHLDDHVRALVWLLERPVAGPVNLTAPNPVTNAEFASTLASVLRRPCGVIPQFGPRLLFGRELADTLLLESQRVLPKKLDDDGFAFRFPELRSALTNLIR